MRLLMPRNSLAFVDNKYRGGYFVGDQQGFGQSLDIVTRALSLLLSVYVCVGKRSWSLFCVVVDKTWSSVVECAVRRFFL